VASGAGTTFFLGPADLHLGIAERALNEPRPAAKSLREACRMSAAAGLPGFLAEAQLELGLTLLDSSSTAAVRSGQDLLTSAAAGASRLGMTAVRRRVEQARAAASPLTARERNVASLVAEGRTNRQIAQQLVVSERTAENHVQHILGKLGLTNRVQVAAWWREQHG
jgi:DNA-binding NarL/FixJ family response regulator